LRTDYWREQTIFGPLSLPPFFVRFLRSSQSPVVSGFSFWSRTFQKTFLLAVGKQKMNYESTLDVGDEIPGFDLDSQLGKIFFKDIVEAKWCLLITFPTAFDPVATTDFGLIGKLFDEFESRNILILAAGYETSIVLHCC
jgi:hypothetical protein